MRTIHLTRRELLRLGGMFVLAQTAGFAARAKAAGSGKGVIAFRRSGRGRRISNAAKKHNANRLYATHSAALSDPAHPGDRSTVVQVVIPRDLHKALFRGGNEIADLRRYYGASKIHPPRSVRVMGGVGAEFPGGSADTYICPTTEDVPLNQFTLEATEDLSLRSVHVTYTGRGPAPTVADWMNHGQGLHTVFLDPAPAPGQWVKLVLHVTGHNSRQDARLTVWLAHHPADVDQDGRVSVRDAKAFGDEYRSRRDPFLLDLNGDRVVNVQDAAVFGSIWRGASPSHRPWRHSQLPPRPL